MPNTLSLYDTVIKDGYILRHAQSDPLICVLSAILFPASYQCCVWIPSVDILDSIQCGQCYKFSRGGNMFISWLVLQRPIIKKKF